MGAWVVAGREDRNLGEVSLGPARDLRQEILLGVYVDEPS